MEVSIGYYVLLRTCRSFKSKWKINEFIIEKAHILEKKRLYEYIELDKLFLDSEIHFYTSMLDMVVYLSLNYTK